MNEGGREGGGDGGGSIKMTSLKINRESRRTGTFVAVIRESSA